MPAQFERAAGLAELPRCVAQLLGGALFGGGDAARRAPRRIAPWPPGARQSYHQHALARLSSIPGRRF